MVLLRVSDQVLPTATPSKTKLLLKILGFRIGYLLLMALSCHFFPDHNPGEDVLRFDMRLDTPTDGCFCPIGQACDFQQNKVTRIKRSIPSNESDSCAMYSNHSTYSSISTRIWKFLLSPLNKWDAARFLHLAAHPNLRDPPTSSECEDGIDSTKNCDFISTSTSEQAHAFFPLFPLGIRYMAFGLMRITTAPFIPPTFEATLVWSGFVLNTICVLCATLALHSLTMAILPTTITSSNSTMPSSSSSSQVAMAVCWVYGIWNPAGIFFSTNYSESFFSCTTLIGHAAFAHGQYGMAIVSWMLASYTRSNGSIQAIWLLLHGLGHLCNYWRNSNNKSSKRSLSRTLAIVMACLLGAVLVILPIRWHDWQGYMRHCNHAISQQQPSWCRNDIRYFSLYGWTQREHWNVGLFRYYQWKQIPNFLLAAPILTLSAWGAWHWIRTSFILDYGKGKWPAAPLALLNWSVQALADSVVPLPSKQNVTLQPKFTAQVHSHLVSNPLLLGHYAILAGLTLVGLLVAHVQISTRLILSSSPAIVWFLTYCHLQTKSQPLRQFLEAYTLLYLILGILLHVNFLPWT